MSTSDRVIVNLKVLFYLLTSVVFYLEALIKALLPRSLFRRDIRGQVVLITGGGSGIGREIAKGLASRGAKVVTWDVNEKGNEETVKQIKKEGGKCWAYTINICNREEVYRMAQKVKKEIGKVEILVNNAGVVTGRPFLECPDEGIQRTFDVNVISHFWMLKAFLPDMKRENKGHVVTIASLAGIFGATRLVDYCSSKFAAMGLDESLRLELISEGYEGIKMTVVCPNFINTGMFAGAKGNLVMPYLEQDYVGREIVDAILMGTNMLYLPYSSISLVAIKYLLPYKTGKLLASCTGALEQMDNFKGRSKSE